MTRPEQLRAAIYLTFDRSGHDPCAFTYPRDHSGINQQFTPLSFTPIGIATRMAPSVGVEPT